MLAPPIVPTVIGGSSADAEEIVHETYRMLGQEHERELHRLAGTARHRAPGRVRPAEAPDAPSGVRRRVIALLRARRLVFGR
jgi:hypothetical protein